MITIVWTEHKYRSDGHQGEHTPEQKRQVKFLIDHDSNSFCDAASPSIYSDAGTRLSGSVGRGVSLGASSTSISVLTVKPDPSLSAAPAPPRDSSTSAASRGVSSARFRSHPRYILLLNRTLCRRNRCMSQGSRASATTRLLNKARLSICIRNRRLTRRRSARRRRLPGCLSCLWRPGVIDPFMWSRPFARWKILLNSDRCRRLLL